MSRNKKANLIYLVDIIGYPIACYQLDSYDSLANLYSNRLLAITEQGLQDYILAPNSNTPLSQKFRFVVAANAEQFQLLLKVQPIKCYLRDKDMSAKILQLNPYHSVGWLKAIIQAQKQQNIAVKLIIEQKQLSQDNQCLLKYIHDDVIIHVIYVENNNNDGTCSLVLYSKQPGADSKLFKIENRNGQNTVQELSKEIEGLVGIPQQHLYMVFSGKILSKNKLIKSYYIQNNSIIYAVDGRKYLKKISQEQYKRRLQQTKKVKQCNKQITQMLQHAIQRKQSQEKQNKYKNKNKNVVKQQEIEQPVYRNSRKPNKYKQERSGTIQANEDDTKYFKEQQQGMNIESQQFLEFDKSAKQLQESRRVQNLQLRHKEPQLQKARMVTNVSDVYQDGQGNIHQHNSQKRIYNDGYKTIDINIKQDKQGNLIQLQQNIINYKQNQATGQTTKIETDIIEDNHNRKTTINKQQTRDKEGNIIRFSTTKHTQNVNQLLQDQGQGSVVVTYQPQTSQQKLIQIGNNGIVHTHQNKVVQGQNKTTFVDNDTYEDAQGTVLAYKTGVVQIEGDQQGNIHKHKSIIVEQGSKKLVEQTNQIINNEGVRVSQQKDLIEIFQAEDGTLIKNQIQIVERQGNMTITQQEVTQDPTGQIVKTIKKIIQIEGGQFQINIHQQQQVQQQVQAVQGQPINVQKQIKITHDENGQVKTQRQYIQDQNGEASLVTTYTVKSNQGTIVQQITQKLQIIDQNSQKPQVLRYITNYTANQALDKIQIQQKNTLEGLDGKVIQGEQKKVQIQQFQDGFMLTCNTNVIETQGNKLIEITNQLKDQQGNVISKTANLIQIQANPVNTQTNQYPLILTTQQTHINKQQEIDQQGNFHVTQTKIIKDQGIQNVVQTQQVYDQQGHIIQKITDIKQSQQIGNGQTKFTVTDIFESGNLTTVVQTHTLVDSQGKQIRSQTGTLQIQKMERGLTRKQKQTIISEGGVQVKVHTQEYADDQGNILEQQVTTTQLLNQPSGDNIVSEVCKRSIDQAQQDQKGHIHHHHRQVQEDKDGKSVVESEVIHGTQNQFLTAKTDVIQQEQNEDGTISKHKANITQKPGKVTVSQNDYIQNTQGEQLIGQVNTIAITQGQNQQTIKKQTNFIMQQNQKIIAQKLIIQDRDGNITSQKCKAQIVYVDQDGIEKKQQLQNYQIQLQPKKQQVVNDQTQKQIVQNEEGNIITSQKQDYENQLECTTIVQTLIIQNKQGQIVSVNTKTVQSLQGQLQNIKRLQTQYLSQQKLIKTQITTITNPDGELKIQKQRGVQISQDLGVIQTSVYDIFKTDGQTTVGLIQAFQDKQGNLLDSSIDVIKVRNSQQAITEHAFKVGQAEAQGQIKGHTEYIDQDENGNKKLIQGQVIDYNGQIITVKTVTTQSPDGQFIKSKTQITQQKIQNGQRQIHQTQIIEQNGKIQVFQHATLQDRCHLAISIEILKHEQNLDDLLGLSNQEQPSTRTANNNQQYDFKFVDSVDNFFQVKQANQTPTKIKNQQQNLLDGDYMQPEQLYISAVDIKRNETNLKIRYDETVNQVINRLKLAISKPNAQIHFYKDGRQLNQYENISDLDISSGDILYYVEDNQDYDQ